MLGSLSTLNRAALGQDKLRYGVYEMEGVNISSTVCQETSRVRGSERQYQETESTGTDYNHSKDGGDSRCVPQAAQHTTTNGEIKKTREDAPTSVVHDIRYRGSY